MTGEVEIIISKRCARHYVYHCEDVVCQARLAYSALNPGWAAPQASPGAPITAPIWRRRWDLMSHGIDPDAYDRVKRGILLPLPPPTPAVPIQAFAPPISAPPALVAAP